MKKNKSIPAYIFSGVGIAYFAFLLVAQFSSVSFVLPFILHYPDLFSSDATIIISEICMYLIAFPIFLLILKSIPDKRLSPSPDKKISGLFFAKLILPAIPVSRLVSYLYTCYLTFFQVEKHPLDHSFEGVHPVILFIAVSIIAPIMEELVFRKYLYDKISAYGSRAYIWTSALFFGLFHLNILQGVYAFILGIFLAWLMYHTGKVIYPILGHFLFNLIGGGIPALLELFSIPEDIYYLICNTMEYTCIGLGIFAGIFLLIDLFKKKIVFDDIGNLPVPTSNEIVINGGYITYFVISLSIIILYELLMLLQALIPIFDI